MRKSAISLLVFALTLACADLTQAHAQTSPPNEPSDFSAYFDATAAPSTIVQLILQNMENPPSSQIQWFPGLGKGDFFSDYTNRRIRVDFAELDGTPEQTQWFFFDKYLQVTFDRNTGTCERIPLDPNFILTPFFAWLRDATLVKTGETLMLTAPAPGSGSPASFVKTRTWQYIFPNGSPVLSEAASTEENNIQAPVSLYWQGVGGRGPALLTFETFVSGQPDASEFSLPSACAP